MSLNCT